jgi:hypothetical protein
VRGKGINWTYIMFLQRQAPTQRCLFDSPIDKGQGGSLAQCLPNMPCHAMPYSSLTTMKQTRYHYTIKAQPRIPGKRSFLHCLPPWFKPRLQVSPTRLQGVLSIKLVPLVGSWKLKSSCSNASTVQLWFLSWTSDISLVFHCRRIGRTWHCSAF